jgi:hypothetical protein
MAMDIVFQRKKNRTQIGQKVWSSEQSCKGKFAKKIDLSRPNCINRLKHSHGTENQKLNWILLKMSKAVRKDNLQCSQGFKALKIPF